MMKTIKYCVLLLAGCLIFISCQDGNMGPTGTNRQLALHKGAASRQSAIYMNMNAVLTNSVSKKLAKNVALNFSKTSSFASGSHQISKGGAQKKMSTKRTIKKVYTVRDSTQQPALYIVKLQPKGYVVVSATKKTYPVIAYSRDTNFDIDHLPGSLAYWFVSSASKIHALRHSNSAGAIGVRKAWAAAAYPRHKARLIKAIVQSQSNPQYKPSLLKTMGESESESPQPPGGPEPDFTVIDTVITQKGPLLSAHWRQWAPFDDLIPHHEVWRSGIIVNEGCPEGEECPAGCVAVAMAQVMYYWKYPARSGPYLHGDPPHAYYHNINWAAMPDQAYESYQPGKVSPEAQLVRDIGIDVGMDYDSSGSTASSKDAKNALINYFGYNSSSVQYIDHLDTTIVMANLNNGEPVILGGYANRKRKGFIFHHYWYYYDGHTWDADGYRKITYKYYYYYPNGWSTEESYSNGYHLHFNWGWGSYPPHDGWYRDNFAPHHDPDHDNFKYHQDMIVGIHP